MMLFYKWKILSIIEAEVEYYGIHFSVFTLLPKYKNQTQKHSFEEGEENGADGL